VLVDVLDRLLERVDDADGHLQAEVLGVPVRVGRGADLDPAGRGADALVADQLDPLGG
jgi:hypothetical protein